MDIGTKKKLRIGIEIKKHNRILRIAKENNLNAKDIFRNDICWDCEYNDNDICDSPDIYFCGEYKRFLDRASKEKLLCAGCEKKPLYCICSDNENTTIYIGFMSNNNGDFSYTK